MADLCLVGPVLPVPAGPALALPGAGGVRRNGAAAPTSAARRQAHHRAARLYGQVVAIEYAVLTVLGLVTAMNLHTLFGFVPLYGNDVWLHALLALVAAYFGFMRPVDLPQLRRR